MQFMREDSNTLIQVGQNLLTINQLAPYSSWQEFLLSIEEGLQAYLEAAHPKSIQRVALQYLNRIEFEQKVQLEDYLNFYPFVGEGLPQEFGAFVVGVQLPYENSRDLLNLQLATLNTEAPNTVAMILDLNYMLARLGEIELDSVLEWVNTAHKRIEETFEACITDRLRQRFKEVIG